MNNAQTSPKLDLSLSRPLCGLELERNGSYATATDLAGVRVGLFFESENSSCNPKTKARIKVWHIADNTMEYFEVTNILGLTIFWESLIKLTDEKIVQKVKSSFDATI